MDKFNYMDPLRQVLLDIVCGDWSNGPEGVVEAIVAALPFSTVDLKIIDEIVGGRYDTLVELHDGDGFSNSDKANLAACVDELRPTVERVRALR